MVENLAVVSEVLSNGNVVCQNGISGICGSCSDQSDDCSTELLKKDTKPVTFIVKNSRNAGLNQVVRIGIPERSVLISAIIAYLIPMIFLIVGAVISYDCGNLFNASNDIITIIGSFIGLIIGIIVAYVVAKIFIKTLWSPRIVGVLPYTSNCKQNKLKTI
jgi:sigma-E factor negative regulatory protein RseC